MHMHMHTPLTHTAPAGHPGPGQLPHSFWLLAGVAVGYLSPPHGCTVSVQREGGGGVIVSASVMVETFLTLKQVRENRVGFQGGVPPKPQPFIWGAVGGARQHLQSQSRTVCGQETQRPLQVNIEGGLPAADPLCRNTGSGSSTDATMRISKDHQIDLFKLLFQSKNNICF